MKYKARDGGPLNNDQAQIAGETFARMKKDGVEITPENVVKEAKKKRSPLHTMFDWDAEHAAEKWWRQYARMVIGCVVTITVETKKPVRAYHNIHVETGQVYRARKEIISNDDDLNEMEAQLYRRLTSVLDEAAGLGLLKRSAWKSINAAVRTYEPIAMRLKAVSAG